MASPFMGVPCFTTSGFCTWFDMLSLCLSCSNPYRDCWFPPTVPSTSLPSKEILWIEQSIFQVVIDSVVLEDGHLDQFILQIVPFDP